jgi:cysteine desulfurase
VYNTLNISFPGIDNQTLLMLLDLENICVSIGSACNAGTPEKSEVLKAMELDKDIIDSSIRISFGRFTAETEIIEFVEKLKKIINRK